MPFIHAIAIFIGLISLWREEDLHEKGDLDSRIDCRNDRTGILGQLHPIRLYIKYTLVVNIV